MVLALFFVAFFRLPARTAPQGAVIVSPADGRVTDVATVDIDGKPHIKVGIFMSVFNVHVNFAPMEGEVLSVKHTPGKFWPAFRPKASELNEHNDMVIRNGDIVIRVRQIAGLIARRIVCYSKAGDRLEKGQRFGMIKFSSKVEVFLPVERICVNVRVGDRIKGKESIIGTVKY